MNIAIDTYNTERLLLRNFTSAVYEYLFTQCTDDEIQKEFGLTSTAELENEKQRFAEGYYANFKNINWFQLIDKTTGKIVGYCGFHIWYKKHSRAEIGYYLLSDEYKQKGLMTEAVSFVLNYGFNIMKLNRVEAFAEPNNIASIKTLTKFGFEKEGYCKEHYYENGVFDDSVLLALLRKNYNER